MKESNLWRCHQRRFSRPFAPTSATFLWWAAQDSNLQEETSFEEGAFTDYASGPEIRIVTTIVRSGAAGVESNPQPPAYKAGALPFELQRRASFGFGPWRRELYALRNSSSKYSVDP